MKQLEEIKQKMNQNLNQIKQKYQPTMLSP